MAALPLLSHAPGAPVAHWRGQIITRERFLAHVAGVAASLPAGCYAINLCADRYLFMVAFAAALIRGQTSLLPASRIAREVQNVTAHYPEHYLLQDAEVERGLAAHGAQVLARAPTCAGEHIAAIAFTSGSTGQPQPNPKRWDSLVQGARLARQRFAIAVDMALLATVPPQHMYGFETSVLLPLVAGASVYGGQPFYPADIAAALAALSAPRVFITTPVHLRVCLQAGLVWPEVALIISATAPLSATLASQAERCFAAPLKEIYGCTEGGSLASRRTAQGEAWTWYDGLTATPSAGGVSVRGGHLLQAIALNDYLELIDEARFELLGRYEDLVNIAGKRASLAALNQRLLEIEGVVDGAFIGPQSDAPDGARLVALVVAPTLSKRQILTALARSMDPVFLPRPVYLVERLPRNGTGKLPRRAVLDLLAKLRRGG